MKPAGQADFFVVMTGVVAHVGQPDCVSKSHGLALGKDTLSPVGMRLKGLSSEPLRQMAERTKSQRCRAERVGDGCRVLGFIYSQAPFLLPFWFCLDLFPL